MGESERFEKLQTFYPWSNDCDISGEFVTCMDYGSMTTDFALDLLFVQQLRRGRRVLLLCTHKPRVHYEMILRRAGLDPVLLFKEKLLHFVLPDPPSVHGGGTAGGFACTPDGPVDLFRQIAASTSSGSGSSRSTASSSSSYLERVKEHLLVPASISRNETGGDGSYHCVVIDDIDCLELLCGSAHATLKVLLQLKQQCSRGVTVLCGSTRPATAAGQDGGHTMSMGARATDYCTYLGTISISVHPLQSGYSNDAHGLLQVSHRLLQRVLQFKLSDVAVKCTVVGDMNLIF